MINAAISGCSNAATRVNQAPLSLALSPSLSLSLPPSLSLSLSLCLCFCLSRSRSLSTSIFVFLSATLSLSCLLSFSFSHPLCLPPSLCLPPFISVCLSLSLSFFLALSFLRPLSCSRVLSRVNQAPPETELWLWFFSGLDRMCGKLTYCEKNVHFFDQMAPRTVGQISKTWTGSRVAPSKAHPSSSLLLSA